MLFSLASIAVCLFPVLSVYAQFDSPTPSPCTTTTTITTTVTRKDTTNLDKRTTLPSTLFWDTVYSSVNVTRTTHIISYLDIVTTKHSISTASTRTLGGYKLITKSCPPGPSYVLACSKFFATETDTETSTVWKGLVTSTYAETYYSYITVNSSLVTSTVTTGKPPTTRTVTSLSTQVTKTTKSTVTATSYRKTVTRTAIDLEVNTTTITTSLASPTATATLDIFSLQITNTSNPIDGYTWGQQGADVVIQNASVWRYYIDPSTQHLIHAPSGNYLAYSVCGADYCYNSFFFVPDKPVPPRNSFNPILPVKCEISCGQLLQCWDEDDSDGRNYLQLIVWDTVLGALIGNVPYIEGGPAVWVSLRAVGPTRGK